MVIDPPPINIPYRALTELLRAISYWGGWFVFERWAWPLLVAG
ncbi:MAG: hypothetical protein AAGI71_14960 [Bacteroidota bacterium]